MKVKNLLITVLLILLLGCNSDSDTTASSLSLPQTSPSTDPLAGDSCDFSNPCSDTTQFCDFTSGACGAADDTGNCRTPPEVCTEDYTPVCGCNGKTYGNVCQAASAKASVYTLGACES
ncbi:MAG: Kazal domain-containing protein [bacterium]|mgnify:CR=1 FL=1|nr:Kazal domain-containing protein [bacterium]